MVKPIHLLRGWYEQTNRNLPKTKKRVAYILARDYPVITDSQDVSYNQPQESNSLLQGGGEMSSKAAKRKAEFEKREARRRREADRLQAIRSATDIESLAKAMGIKLK